MPNQQVDLEALPSILVLHLERFLYNAATDDVKKISKVCSVCARARNPTRNHRTRSQEIRGVGGLQAAWGALPPR